MKILELRTLEQFIDFIESFTDNEIKTLLGLNKYYCLCYEIDFHKYKLIVSYNELLKQPIKKNISNELKLVNDILIWENFEHKTLGGHFKNWKDVANHMTLKDIAEKTGGKLKVKNLEI